MEWVEKGKRERVVRYSRVIEKPQGLSGGFSNRGISFGPTLTGPITLNW